MTNLITR